jgi:hypothetical protein
MSENSFESKKSWWQKPWGYKESLAVVAGLLVVGNLLQWIAGHFPYELIAFPVNFYLLLFMMVVIAGLTFRYKSALFQWLAGVPLSVANIAALLLYSIIMGFIPQAPSSQHGHSLLGIDAITRSWPFVIIYCFTLINLSCVITRRMLNFSSKDYAFYLNHIGLLLMLYAAGLGATDLRRFVMHVQEGETEWRVYGAGQEVLELPVAIKLNDFYMEEYVPKLAIIDRRTGEMFQEGKTEMWQIDTLRKSGRIAHWSIALDEYIHDAIRMNDSSFHRVPMPGSCPAAKVRVTHAQSGEKAEGWISCGNFAQLYMTLPLNDTLLMVMSNPEPKLYRSDIVVYSKSGEVIEHRLEVNKPLKVDYWTIYQYSFDSERGKASSYSSFELVYDPWITGVYAGLILFMLGSVLLIWEGNKKAKLRKDDQLG